VSLTLAIIPTPHNPTRSDRVNDVRYRILKNIPGPPKRPGKKGAWSHLPLDDLEEGDMLEIPLHEDEVKERITSLRTHASRLGKRTGKQFSVRIIKVGVGIWREGGSE
jgi:hypothetical protein